MGRLTGAAIDPTFGNGGVVISDLATSRRGFNALSVDISGSAARIAAGATVGGPASQDVAVARFNPDGSPLTSFGSNGNVVVDLGGPSDTLGGLTFDWHASPDPPLVLAGGDGADMVGAKLDGRGALLPLGGATEAKIDFGRPSEESGLRVAVQADGKLVVAGSGGSGLTLVRLLPDGDVNPGGGRRPSQHGSPATAPCGRGGGTESASSATGRPSTVVPRSGLPASRASP